MKFGIYGTIATITITSGISIYLIQKFISLTTKMVAKTKATNISKDILKVDETDSNKQSNTSSKLKTAVNENNNIDPCIISCHDHEKGCNIEGAAEKELLVTDLSYQPSMDDRINSEILILDKESSTNSSMCEQDDCMQEMILPSYEISSNQKLQEPSELSSACSSISPVSDMARASPKIEDSFSLFAEISIDYDGKITLLNNDKTKIVSVIEQAIDNDDEESDLINVIINTKTREQMQANSNRVDTKENIPVTSVQTIDQPTFITPEDRQPKEDDYLFVYSENFVYCIIDIPNKLVGKLLGKKGSFVRRVHSDTGVTISVDEMLKNDYKKCYIRGMDSQVCKALDMIERLFPAAHFPEMVDALNDTEIVLTRPQNKITVDVENIKESRPSVYPLPVKVTGISTVNSVYVQPLNHPLYPHLEAIEKTLQTIYSKYVTPNIPFPCAVGSICVGFIYNEWQRCEVVECRDSTVIVFIVDKGYTIEVKPSELKLALKSVTKIPFFAAQVFLNGIQVYEESLLAGNQWLCEVVSRYETVITLVGRDMGGVPIVNLFAIREDKKAGLLNCELASLKYAHWNFTNMICDEER